MATSEPVRRSAAALLRLTCRPEVTGMDQVPAEGPFIMASNHLSFFDSVILQALAPRPVHFFAKEEYFTGAGVRGRAQRWFFESVGSVPVRRGEQAASVAALESLVGLLDSGQGVGIYPEGTRSRDGRLYRGRTGAAWLALTTGAPVVPVGLVDTQHLQPPDTNGFRPHRFAVRVGAWTSATPAGATPCRSGATPPPRSWTPSARSRGRSAWTRTTPLRAPVADPASYRPAPGEISTSPGVYRFRDADGRVVYVGKAKNLRARLGSYFQDPARLTTKTRTMVFTAAAVEWTVVGSELEALQLEYTWIKEYRPRFNIMYRDDKSYPYLAVTMNEQFPRVQVMRGDRRPGVKYFGPFHPAKAIRETVDLMLRVFPVRTCSAGVFKRARAQDRPCLLGYIGKCSAPCVGRISPAEHRELAQDFCDFMAGDAQRFIRELERAMQGAVEELRYEDAARLRDDIAALRRVFERNAVVLPESTEADIFALHADELEVAVQVFHVRQGRIRGQRGWVMERVEDVSEPEMVTHLLQQVYGDLAGEDRIPHEILVPAEPDDAAQLVEWLSGLRGARVNVRVPRRGTKADLMETVRENAEMALKLHKSRRSGDLTTRSAALRELQEALEIAEPLLRIECYDISHSQGTNVVGSMVVMEDGLPKKKDYRRFNVTGEAARDDTASMKDVLSRRFARLAEERAEGAPLSGQLEGEEEGRDRRFAYPPSLVVVDGGPPQVAAAAAVLEELGLDDLPVVGLAKRLEEVWLPGDEFPVVLPRTSEALYLLQRIRDESHRFAIAGHRGRRAKAMTASALDGISGLGPAKRTALLNHFGSVAQIRAAGVERLTEVAGIGPTLAQTVHAALAPAEPTDTVEP